MPLVKPPEESGRILLRRGVGTRGNSCRSWSNGNPGEVTALDDYKDNSSKNLIRLDNQGTVARENINTLLSKIPGSASIGSSDNYWTSSEYSESSIVGVSFIGDGSFYFINDYKTMLTFHLRCAARSYIT